MLFCLMNPEYILLELGGVWRMSGKVTHGLMVVRERTQDSSAERQRLGEMHLNSNSNSKDT